MTPLIRFHLRTSVRLALAAAVPLAGVFTVGIGMDPYPGQAVAAIARAVAGWPPTPNAVLAVVALSLSLAWWAAPRVTLGSEGWIRHLPVSTAAHRRSIVVAIACAQAPLTAALVALGLIDAMRTGTIKATSVLAPPSLALATAYLASHARPAGRRRHAWRIWLPDWLPFDLRVAWRALAGRMAEAWAVGAIPLVAGFLFVRNNDLPVHLAGIGASLSGGLAATVTLAFVADALAVRRPSWPWARSLPESSPRRVIRDAIILGAHAAVQPLTLALLNVRAALIVVLVVPLLSLRAATAMRRGGITRTAAWGSVLIEGGFLSALIALLPWLTVVALGAIPLALRVAVARERALKVTRWRALHHAAAGDAL
jgi:hypothetical protein